MTEVKNKTIVSNFVWRFFERFGAQIISLLVTIILARILLPEAYGTVALITVITSLLQVFIDSGLGSALIQKKDADDVDFSSVFYFNVVLCVVLYLIMFFLAPAIAKFYERSEMIAMIRVVSLILLICGARNVQQAYVARNMLFKRFFFSTLAGTIGGAVAGIVMAYYGFGAWALIAQMLLNNFLGTAILWITVKWRPKWKFSFSKLMSLINYGWKILVAGLVVSLYNNLAQLIIGKKYSSEDLAYYNKGKQFPTLIMESVNSSLDSVLFSTLSKEQRDIEKVRDLTRKSIQLSSYLVCALMFGFAACAELFVKVVLTDKWLFAVPYIRIFCLILAIHPIDTANLNAFKALGKSNMYLTLELIKKGVGIVLLLISIPFGINAMLGSLMLSAILNIIINTWPSKRLLGYSLFKQIKDFIPSMLLAIIMFVIVYLIGKIPGNAVLILGLQLLMGAVIYISLSWLFKNSAFKYVVNFIKNSKKGRNSSSKSK